MHPIGLILVAIGLVSLAIPIAVPGRITDPFVDRPAERSTVPAAFSKYLGLCGLFWLIAGILVSGGLIPVPI